MYRPVMEDVTEMKMSQFRDGSLGRFSHDFGIPVYWRTVRMPDGGIGVAEGAGGFASAF